MRLISVNIGQPETIASKSGKTGIFKRPVAGPVAIGPLGLAGDAIIDKKHHGGADQAVYLYLESDYAWWSKQLGRKLDPGTFGENLTLAGLANDQLAAGDRIGIGPVLLEINSHRTPCATFSARMGDRKWAKRFHGAGRSGAYCRVLSPGAVTAGDAIDYQPFTGDRVTVAQMMALDGVRDIDKSMLRRCLAAPIHWKMRADFEARLAKLQA